MDNGIINNGFVLIITAYNLLCRFTVKIKLSFTSVCLFNTDDIYGSILMAQSHAERKCEHEHGRHKMKMLLCLSYYNNKSLVGQPFLINRTVDRILHIFHNILI